MALLDESGFDEYWNSFDNVVIYLSNVSPYYVLSVLVSFFAVFAVVWHRNISSCFTAIPHRTTKSDVQQDHVHEEELEAETVKNKGSADSLLNKFPDSLITEDFVHNALNDTSDGPARQVSPEDPSGGDGNFKQQKDPKEMKEPHKFGDEVDTQPNPLSRFKKARQAAILERVTGDMNEEQLREEKEVEASQIAAIWDLLKQQKEQFNIGSEQELQDQLHLYCL